MSEVKTEGQKRVRSGFNPSEKIEVATAKARAAELIDEALATGTRAGSIAATEYETACMYHVKALTEDQS